MSSAVPPVLLYNGVFTPIGALPLELFFHAHRIAYQIVSDEELSDFRFLPEHSLFIFPAGHHFGPTPPDALGGPAGISNLKQALANGLNYLGICAGAFAATGRSFYPIDIALGLTPARHRWPGQTGAGVQFFTVKLEPTLAREVGAEYTRIWYHNGPILSRNLTDQCQVLATFEPTPEEREQTCGGFLFRKQLAGAPAILRCRCGRGQVVLISPHPELGNAGIRDYQARLRAWEGAHGGPLDEEPVRKAFLNDLGGEWMESVRQSTNWRLLGAIVSGLARSCEQ